MRCVCVYLNIENIRNIYYIYINIFVLILFVSIQISIFNIYDTDDELEGPLQLNEIK